MKLVKGKYLIYQLYNFKNKQMYTTKQKQIHKYRKQTHGCQWSEETREGEEDQNMYMCTIDE